MESDVGPYGTYYTCWECGDKILFPDFTVTDDEGRDRCGTMYQHYTRKHKNLKALFRIPLLVQRSGR